MKKHIKPCNCETCLAAKDQEIKQAKEEVARDIERIVEAGYPLDMTYLKIIAFLQTLK